MTTIKVVGEPMEPGEGVYLIRMMCTPGPWKLVDRRPGFAIQGPDRRIVASISALVRKGVEEKLANARLLAAAPELLAVCREIATLDPDCTLGRGDLRRRLFKAVSKAERG